MGDCLCGDQHIKDLVSIDLTLLYCPANKAHRNMEGHYPYTTHQEQTSYIFLFERRLHFIPILSNNVWTGLNLSQHRARISQIFSSFSFALSLSFCTFQSPNSALQSGLDRIFCHHNQPNYFYFHHNRCISTFRSLKCAEYV